MSLCDFPADAAALIIDDCGVFRTATRQMLYKLGLHEHQVLLAEDAESARRLMRTQRVEMLLCDYNLGDAADGHQLFDELQSSGLLSPTCVSLIVTAEAAPRVVRGFLELGPDGYLVKPLSFAKLAERLPRLYRRKLLLEPVLLAKKSGDWALMAERAAAVAAASPEVAACAGLLRAQALQHSGALDAARNQLILLRDGPERVAAQLAMAEISIRQRQFEQAQDLLAPLGRDLSYGARVTTLWAEVAIRQGNYDLAADKLNEAIALSPKLVTRHLLLAEVNAARFELALARDAMDAALRYAAYSCRETIELHHRRAQLTLDLAQLNQSQRAAMLNDFANQCKSWRNRFERVHYKPCDLLLLARSNLIRGLIGVTRQLLDEYQQLLTSTDYQGYQPHQVEQAELTKLTLLLGHKRDSGPAQDAADQPAQLAFNSYHAHWLMQLDQQVARSEQLKKQSQTLLLQGELQLAATALATAFAINPVDHEISLRLTACLTRSWPRGWARNDVIALARRCRDVVVGMAQRPPADFFRDCRLLASQLQVNELVIESGVSA